ncbi:citrate synthase family protein [Comamonas serinivorans]|nr:citrate synthase family protein [Comamonas serinivorans]
MPTPRPSRRTIPAAPVAPDPSAGAPEAPWLSAAEAARLLGIQRGSLYSYVSRGQLQAERLPGERASRYLRSDVMRLVRERRTVRNPARVAQAALEWGRPVLDSAVTLVDEGKLYYRGVEAVAWSDHATLEDTARLLWQGIAPALGPSGGAQAHGGVAEATPIQGQPPTVCAEAAPAPHAQPRSLDETGRASDERATGPLFASRVQEGHARAPRRGTDEEATRAHGDGADEAVAVAKANETGTDEVAGMAVDAERADQADAAVATAAADVARQVALALARWHAPHALAHAAWPDVRTPDGLAWAMLGHMATALLDDEPVGSPRGADPGEALHRRLARRWGASAHAADVLRRALVLCADHELNASSFAVRVVASSGASLHASLGAGLAALSGPLHGGMTQRIEAQWDAWHGRTAAQGLSPSLRAQLARRPGGLAPGYCAGFGHPLYPQGDPRAASLLRQLPPDAARERLLAQVLAHTGQHPSLDYALVAVRRALHLPMGSAFVLFALGRTVGWIAHAQEQRDSGQLIRPRARYVGVAPQADQPPEPTWPGARRVHFG